MNVGKGSSNRLGGSKEKGCHERNSARNVLKKMLGKKGNVRAHLPNIKNQGEFEKKKKHEKPRLPKAGLKCKGISTDKKGDPRNRKKKGPVGEVRGRHYPPLMGTTRRGNAKKKKEKKKTTVFLMGSVVRKKRRPGAKKKTAVLLGEG